MTDAEKAATSPVTAAPAAPEVAASTGGETDAKPDSNGAAATPATTAAAGEHYPPAVSSYYFGAPDASRAFGEPVTGKPGVHVPKEIVRIERDYAAGELPQFHPAFPLELEGRISPTTFSELINDINALLVHAHNPRRIWTDNALAIATFYLSTLLFGSAYTRTMHKLDTLVSKANAELLHPVGLSMVHPARSAFLFIELEYF